MNGTRCLTPVPSRPMHKCGAGARGVHQAEKGAPRGRRVAAPPTVDWLGLYLLEDLGTGDITSDALFGPEARATAQMVAREACVVAGLRHAVEVFQRLGAVATPKVKDGAAVKAGTVILVVAGPARAVLAGERVALNLVGRMSGIATATRACMQALATACSAATVAATRKTTPGFRFFEKEAVVLGGGVSHRLGLWDEAMLKDNHLEMVTGRALGDVAAADVGRAVAQVVANNPGKTVCCEVESLPHALAAAGAGAQWLLIDNQPPKTGQAWAAEVVKAFPQIRIEASGGITPANVAAFGWADRISLGALTQKTAAIDIGLDWGAA